MAVENNLIAQDKLVEWVTEIYWELQAPTCNVEHLTKLASNYLTHLMIACKSWFC